jgi:hypothetical protein
VVFERPFTVIRPISNNGTATGLVAFVVILILMLVIRVLAAGRSGEARA